MTMSTIVCSFPETFSTYRLMLRPVGSNDAAAIFNSYAQDADVTRFLTWRPHTCIEETESFVQICLTAKTSRTYVIVNKARNSVVGVLDLRLESQARLELGYALARQFWGRGLMTEVLIKVRDWGLGQSSIWRMGAVADIENVGSIRVLEKTGFQREGILHRDADYTATSHTGTRVRGRRVICIIFLQAGAFVMRVPKQRTVKLVQGAERRDLWRRATLATDQMPQEFACPSLRVLCPSSPLFPLLLPLMPRRSPVLTSKRWLA
ncbi:MAG: N-acetyltransferase [Oxalobacteraceae bacterium]|nr:MAG: N-acetyltransferase [Oxalobacteraceae bacterium]